ncbi:Hypothetical_protein [Hexamita inflata]|uniref:Hypothetical_protein n=1 Tax=Hexamita inflata TaxID=28002 RepID=A0AA86PGU1_9EUKA|nr:Hypothetical protein HINF_LOCUS25661 [Hexamita inflata]
MMKIILDYYQLENYIEIGYYKGKFHCWNVANSQIYDVLQQYSKFNITKLVMNGKPLKKCDYRLMRLKISNMHDVKNQIIICTQLQYTIQTNFAVMLKLYRFVHCLHKITLVNNKKLIITIAKLRGAHSSSSWSSSPQTQLLKFGWCSIAEKSSIGFPIKFRSCNLVSPLSGSMFDMLLKLRLSVYKFFKFCIPSMFYISLQNMVSYFKYVSYLIWSKFCNLFTKTSCSSDLKFQIPSILSNSHSVTSIYLMLTDQLKFTFLRQLCPDSARSGTRALLIRFLQQIEGSGKLFWSGLLFGAYFIQLVQCRFEGIRVAVNVVKTDVSVVINVLKTLELVFQLFRNILEPYPVCRDTRGILSNHARVVGFALLFNFI